MALLRRAADDGCLSHRPSRAIPNVHGQSFELRDVERSRAILVVEWNVDDGSVVHAHGKLGLFLSELARLLEERQVVGPALEQINVGGSHPGIVAQYRRRPAHHDDGCRSSQISVDSSDKFQ